MDGRMVGWLDGWMAGWLDVVSVLTSSAYLEFESSAGDIEVIYLLLPVSTATHTIYLQLFKRREEGSQESQAKKQRSNKQKAKSQARPGKPSQRSGQGLSHSENLAFFPEPELLLQLLALLLADSGVVVVAVAVVAAVAAAAAAAFRIPC